VQAVDVLADEVLEAPRAGRPESEPGAISAAVSADGQGSLARFLALARYRWRARSAWWVTEGRACAKGTDAFGSGSPFRCFVHTPFGPRKSAQGVQEKSGVSSV